MRMLSARQKDRKFPWLDPSRSTLAKLAVSLTAGCFVFGFLLSPSGLAPPPEADPGPAVPNLHLRAVGSENLSGLGRLGFRRLQTLVNRIDDASDSCLRAGSVDRGSAQKAELSKLFRLLAVSPTARTLLDRAWRNDVYVCTDPDTGLLAYYLSGLRLIGLNPALTQGQKLAFLAHELAHMPQHPAYSDNRSFPPDDLFLLRRVREAAAEAVATQIAWEMKTRGFSQAWTAKYADRFYGDIARAYLENIDPTTAEGSPVVALRSAFDRWFAAPNRVDLYDRMTLDHLQRISGDAMGLVPPRRALSHDFLLGIAYIRHFNYLSDHPGALLTDPYYAGNISAENAELLRQIVEGILPDGDMPGGEDLGTAITTKPPVTDQSPWAVLRR